MKAKFQGVEYVIEVLDRAVGHSLINHIRSFTHVGPMPSLHLGWSTTPQVYLAETGFYVTAVVGASQYINWIAYMTPVETIRNRLQALLTS